MEQRLAVAAAIGAGSHIVSGGGGAGPAANDEQEQRRQLAAAGIALGQPAHLMQVAPPEDADAAQYLDPQGLVVCLPDPLQVQSGTDSFGQQ